MIRFKKDNIPGLLQQVLHAEAQKIEPPARRQLWAKLQQRPEFADARKNAEQLFPQLDVPKLEKPKRTGSGLYAFYRRHPGLTGLIAAGLLLVVFLSRLIPFQLVPLMKQSDSFPLEESAVPETGRPESMLAGDNGGNAVLFTKKMETATGGGANADENAPPESFGLRSHVEGAAPAPGGEVEPAGDRQREEPALGVSPAQDRKEIQSAGESELTAESQPAAESQPEKETRQSPATFSIQAGEPPVSDTPPLESSPRDSQFNRSLRTAPGEQIFEEQVFTEEKPFLLALKEARQLIAEEVWQVKVLPEKVSFAEGIIVRTAETLRQVEQKFAGEAAGAGFTLSQQFLPEGLNSEADADLQPEPGDTKDDANADLPARPGEARNGVDAGYQDITGETKNKTGAEQQAVPGETKTGINADLPIAQGPTQPMQVGPYRGYLQRTSPEHCTLTWLQEKSTVTLSGQLTDETLYQVLAALESPA